MQWGFYHHSGCIFTAVMAVAIFKRTVEAAYQMPTLGSSCKAPCKSLLSEPRLQSRSFVFRKVRSWEHTLSDYEHKSVAATFTSQLQDLDRHCPDASKLLRVIAFFDLY